MEAGNASFNSEYSSPGLTTGATAGLEGLRTNSFQNTSFSRSMKADMRSVSVFKAFLASPSSPSSPASLLLSVLSPPSLFTSPPAAPPSPSFPSPSPPSSPARPSSSSSLFSFSPSFSFSSSLVSVSLFSSVFSPSLSCSSSSSGKLRVTCKATSLRFSGLVLAMVRSISSRYWKYSGSMSRSRSRRVARDWTTWESWMRSCGGWGTIQKRYVLMQVSQLRTVMSKLVHTLYWW